MRKYTAEEIHDMAYAEYNSYGEGEAARRTEYVPADVARGLLEALVSIADSEEAYCPRCESNGLLWADGLAHGPNYTGPTIPCPECGGDGIIGDAQTMKNLARAAIAEAEKE